jgi:hypothetical protein
MDLEEFVKTTLGDLDKGSGMSIDLNAHQIGVKIRLSMKEDGAAVAAGHHERDRQGIPRTVFESSPDRTRSRP